MQESILLAQQLLRAVPIQNLPEILPTIRPTLGALRAAWDHLDNPTALAASGGIPSARAAGVSALQTVLVNVEEIIGVRDTVRQESLSPEQPHIGVPARPLSDPEQWLQAAIQTPEPAVVVQVPPQSPQFRRPNSELLFKRHPRLQRRIRLHSFHQNQ